MTVSTRVVVARPGSSRPLLERATFAEPTAHQVLVAIEASGICQSQIHQIANAASAPPGSAIRALGHEAVGIVREVGEDVTNVSPGEHALVSWLPDASIASARTIERARIKLSDGTVAESPDVFTWADFCLVDEAYIYALNGPVKPELAVIGCAVATGAGAVLHTGGLQPGQDVAVIGVGGVGANAIAAAKAGGAGTIAAIDIDAARLDYARSLGATITINTAETRDARALESHGLGGTVNLVIDCVGTQTTLDMAMDMVQPGTPGVHAGGVAVIVGVAREPVSVDIRALQLHEKRLVGSYGGSTIVGRDFPTYLAWAEHGVLDLEVLVTRDYELADVERAVEDLKRGEILGRGLIRP